MDTFLFFLRRQTRAIAATITVEAITTIITGLEIVRVVLDSIAAIIFFLLL
jgi:hypothetical protein